MRTLGFGALFIFLAVGCGSSSGGTPGNSPATCPAGEVLDPTSQTCAPCEDDTRLDSNGTSCVKVGWQNCPQGFVVDATGYGCIDVSPPADCAAGTMPTIGNATCQPVGVTSCAQGFSPDPSGWGCVAIAPAASCSGATMEKLGSATCVPVGDCGATFPPAAATLFVSPGAVVDATHFTTISAALAAAADGATIAVDTGTYSESIALTHSVHVVGRCPAQVTISGAANAGVTIGAVTGATINGVTITGHSPGVQITAGGSLTLASVVVDANSAAGVSVSGASSAVEIDDSVVRATTASASAKGDGVDLSDGATATLQRSAVVANTEDGIYVTGAGTKVTVSNGVVTDTLSNAGGNFGIGIQVVTNATGEVEQTYVARNHEAGLVAAARADLDVTQTVISNNVPSVAGYGRGITIDGAHVTIEESTVAQNVDVGIAVEDVPGALEAKNTVFRAQIPNADHTKGAGVSASSGGVVTLTGVALVGNSEEAVLADGAGSTLTMNGSIARDGVMLAGNTAGNGAVAQNGGKLVLQGSALIANHESGLLLFDGATSADVTLSIIARQLPSQGNQFGRGVVLQNGPSLTLSQSVIANNTDIGLSAVGANTTATVTESVVRDTASQISDGTHGRALNIIEQAQATVTNCELYDNAEVAALVSGTSAQLTIVTSVLAHTQLDKKTSSAGRAFASQQTGIGAISGSAVLDNFEAAVSSAGANAQLTVDTTLIDGTKGVLDSQFGDGILANDASTLTLSNTTSRNNFGVGVIVGGSTATVSHCRILNNAVGINVQDGSSLSQVASVPTAPNALDVDVSNDTVFDGNQTRIGSDEVPIPTAL